mmetsp:Transcript_20308/g.45124  ORF Transcript_20308/g.45124 Transcript_20308/m.45124 type:complete len:478 (-) Transcript_20308:253-1686(-)|eukprot:CAMPEP_0204341978 /NCGR_PEP_ID=MMETSP0469-20131031/23777_1 /ASSEMBLY_ACC=CAM_ASM_000384 /TAXON_ID=2969 /ORGANISM="Oxyrrhis marina" /LENGTH=477 /DNA_ID=CAMNT_0051326801 /DNA_START=18 /DNA_END=1451 /DNA_ORIENTATION=+
MAAQPLRSSQAEELSLAEAPPTLGAVVKVADEGGLPDLSDRLQQYGIYGEYLEYRRNYLQWRQGRARGAQGEATVEALAARSASPADPNKYEVWVPSESQYRFFFTISYWLAITFLQGSLLFTLAAGVASIDTHSRVTRALTKWPNAIGGFLFVIGTYCGYVELINAGQDGTRRVWLWPRWRRLTRVVDWDSTIGSISYFVGAILFEVGPVHDVLPDWGQPAYVEVICHACTFGGGVLFLVGGVCEVTHNCVWGTATVRDPVYWVSVCNCVGGILFFFGGTACFWFRWVEGFAEFEQVNYFVGSGLFAIGSVLLVVMWRANSFGMTLLRQVNLALQIGGRVRTGVTRGTPGVAVMTDGVEADEEVAEQGKFSIRGVTFLVIYCWLWCAVAVNCAVSFSLRQPWWRHFADAAMGGLWLAVVTVVLLVHSTVTSVPPAQPYRFVLFAFRFILTVATGVQTCVLVQSLPSPPTSPMSCSG